MSFDLVTKYLNLSDEGVAFLRMIEQQMSIVADLSRADILLYARKSEDELIVLSHAQPHSLAHVYSKGREGRTVSIEHRPEILKTLVVGERYEGHRSIISEGAPVLRRTVPVYFPPAEAQPDSVRQNGWSQEEPQIIAALIVVTTLIEHERQRLRSQVFQRTVRNLQTMLISGQLVGAETLTPFGELDGIIVTDGVGIIRYASGIGANLYRRIGYKETLVGRPLAALETNDEELRLEALAQKRCMEQESYEGNLFWIRKVVPLINYPHSRWPWLKPFNKPRQPREGEALILLHDATETRRQDEELRIKNAMIQEVHHRVKNNLQTIAGLLRMQSRRVKSEEARTVLDETLSRVLSVAVIHEFLSNDSSNIINVKEVSHRILSQLQYGMISPEVNIQLELTGEAIYLPSRQATACSLVINELVQNAIEHGFEVEQAGLIQVNLEDHGDEVIITVADNGDGLPDDFDMEQADSLGLQIVKILVEGDLKGKIQLGPGLEDGCGLSVQIRFSKSIFQGEEGWKEHVSL